MGNDVAAHLKSSLCAGSLVLFSVVSAGATEICVKCTGPDASYACIVKASSAGMMDTAAKLYCITALAKSGPHASCSIDRNTTPPCQGERKELPLPSAIEGALGEPSPDPSAPAANAPVPSPGTAPSAPPLNGAAPAEQPPSGSLANVPPKTVQEMVEKSAQSAGDDITQSQKSAGDAAKTAGTALQKAGSAVGAAAKASWKCLSSFFSNC
jgi:hypothetical protein